MIIFDPTTHTYRVDGVIKPSVTQLLKSAGITGDYEGVSEYYRDRGTRVHNWCTLYAQGWLDDLSCVDDDCLVYVETFKSIVARLELSYVSAEVLCYDEALDYCGQYDLIMMWDGKRTLVELKTGIAPMWLGLQLAAYERMVKVDAVMGIELKTGKIYVPADDWERNHDTLRDIHTGNFVLADWKVDKKRRRMNVLKAA